MNYIIPKIGEIKPPSPQLGRKYSTIWLECPDCGKCRWVMVKDTHQGNFTGLCHKCSSKRPTHREPYKHKDGRQPTSQGYFRVKLQPDDFFYPMTDHSGYVFEHRLVMGRYLGRNLHRWELVHHMGTKFPSSSKENKGDNRRENLQLVTDDRHKQITILERRIAYLEKTLRDANVKFSHNGML